MIKKCFSIAATLMVGCANQAVTLRVPGDAPSLGMHSAPSGECSALIELGRIGTGRHLRITDGRGASEDLATDATGIAWVSATTLAYSIGPLYGKPGLYAADCRNMTKTILVAATNRSADYPDGADYFELIGYDSTDRKITYYYAPDVDAMSAATLRTPSNIRYFRLQQ